VQPIQILQEEIRRESSLGVLLGALVVASAVAGA
jgi:hypothetical protein